jgi:hypothetical protein
MYFYGTLCCPRVAQVLEVFYRRVEEGVYPPLPPRSSVDWALLVQVLLQYIIIILIYFSSGCVKPTVLFIYCTV